ncbi:unnamed protein product [Pedinophyceae sp. YPF-701]|nr:unnamed protein product [Pedinophyceae sp. YPF-701]
MGAMLSRKRAAPDREGSSSPVRKSTRTSATQQSASTVAQEAEAADAPWMLVGLGNPGPKYAGTRHNIGFDAIDTLAEAHGLAWEKKLESNAQVARGAIHGRPVLLVKPMTFMNVSGESVKPLSKRHGIPLSNVLVVYDDLDLPAAKVRVREKGGHGGHNGMRSIIGHFGGSHDFPRVKIGIGRPEAGMSVPEWVLGRFFPEEQSDMEEAVLEAVAAMESIVGLGANKAASGQRLTGRG